MNLGFAYIMYVFVSSSGRPVFTTSTTHDQKPRSHNFPLENWPCHNLYGKIPENEVGDQNNLHLKPTSTSKKNLK